MKITKEDVIELRKKTGAGLMTCKKALSATDGDIEKAVEYLKNHNPHVMIYHPPITDEDVKPNK